MSLSIRGKKVVITAGPTREYWDPVRYFTNASSGKMGIALAQEASRLGAHVTLILGPLPNQDFKAGRIHIIPVISAWDMYQSVKKHIAGTDVFIGAAAVVDYRPEAALKRKIKRHDPWISLRMQGNPDIIAMVGHLGKDRPRTVVGFALETDHMLANAQQKLVRKRLDWIVANRESNMGQSAGEGTLLSRWGDILPFPKTPKDKLAKKLWKTILASN
jgi:phosphopantothenoylcysteine decarboxylase/phosphopantothenate--cysteine ligase